MFMGRSAGVGGRNTGNGARLRAVASPASPLLTTTT